MNRNPDLLDYLWPRSHGDLIRQFVSREIQSRYRASLMGNAWLVLNPVLMLLVYTLVFKEIFNARWNGSAEGSSFEFALYLYAGLAVFSFFAECLGRAPQLIVSQPNLVKKVAFPLEILPWVSMLAAAIHLVIALGLLLLVILVSRQGLPPSALAVPLIWASLVPLCLGLGWLFASLGVFLRDTAQFLGFVVSLTMFLSPVFYPLSALPERWRPFLMLNPLTLPIEETRRALLEGHWPHWTALGIHLLACVGVALLGAAFFRATRNEFADAL